MTIHLIPVTSVHKSDSLKVNQLKIARNIDLKAVARKMLKIIFLVILSAIIRIKCVKANEYKIVETENGCVRGRIVKGFDQKIHFAFKGIPFAKPPIGERRFKVKYSVFFNFSKQRFFEFRI